MIDDKDRDDLSKIILETLNIVAYLQAEISNLRAAMLYKMDNKYSEALQLLHADRKNTTDRLMNVLLQLKQFSAGSDGREH